MPTYQSSPPYTHGNGAALGVLLVNLGTPDAPTTAAVRDYLGQFLWDPRVVELPRPLWWLALHFVILRLRPRRSAAAYKKIWTDEGSPLLLHSSNIANGIRQRLLARLSGNVHVALGMSYGQPSITSALDEFYAAGVQRILVLPLYPQYSGTTTASVFDSVTAALARRRWVPELRFISSYFDAPRYILALADSVREHWEAEGRGDKLLLSFHGVPELTRTRGDPYHCQCQKTGRLLAEALKLNDDEWALSFQSRVGRAEWLRPYTDETVTNLGKQGVKKLDVICPGFSADCLETLEEIEMQNAKLFIASGGGSLRYIPALNDRDSHIDCLCHLIERHTGGWPEASSELIASEIVRELDESRRRAVLMGAAQ